MAAITTRAGKGTPLTNAEVDANFTNLNTELGGKQDALVSGTNIKTVNGSSLLGAGNVVVTDATKLPLAGGTMTGAISFAAGQTWPTFNQNTTGSAATLTTARTINEVSFNGSANVTIPRVRAIDDRTTAPLDTTAAYATFAFGSWANNSTAPYADNWIMRSYTDASGGNDNMVSFRKDAIGMRIWQQAYGSSAAFATYVDVLHSGNYNSYAPTLTGTGASGTWAINIGGNAVSASSAATLTTARNINGVSFNGSADITVADATKLPLAGGTMTGAITFAGAQTWPTFNQNTTGSAATLTTARTINGVSFNGSANITIADSTKLPLTGGTLTGTRPITFDTAGGGVQIKGDAAGWATGLYFIGSSGTNRGGFGALGSSDALTNLWLGPAYNSTWMTFSSTANNSQVALQQSGNQVLHAGNYTSYRQDRIQEATGNYLLLSSANEIEFFNSAGVLQPMYLQYSGDASSLRGPAGNIVLHAGNYNSYSPTLTGGGASGTWGISVTGSAATLTTGRTIAMTGDVTYTSPSFNGSANVTAAATLATVNANVGAFGSSTAIPVVTVNAKGLVTAVSTATVAGGQYFGTAATKAIAYNANTIAENVTITAGNNGLSAGPITINTGFTVTVATGGSWSIV